MKRAGVRARTVRAIEPLIRSGDGNRGPFFRDEADAAAEEAIQPENADQTLEDIRRELEAELNEDEG